MGNVTPWLHLPLSQRDEACAQIYIGSGYTDAKIFSTSSLCSLFSPFFMESDIPGMRIFIEVKVNFHFLDLFMLHHHE